MRPLSMMATSVPMTTGGSPSGPKCYVRRPRSWFAETSPAGRETHPGAPSSICWTFLSSGSFNGFFRLVEGDIWAVYGGDAVRGRGACRLATMTIATAQPCGTNIRHVTTAGVALAER